MMPGIHRYSLLFYLKKDSLGYEGARWDTVSDVDIRCKQLTLDVEKKTKSVVWNPATDILEKIIEPLYPGSLPYSGFLAIGVHTI